MDEESKNSMDSLLGVISNLEDQRGFENGRKFGPRLSLIASWLITAVLLFFLIATRGPIPCHCTAVSDWRDSDFATVKEDLRPGLHDIRYQATLKYNSSHELYRPITQPEYVGSPTPGMDAEWEKLIGATDVFVTPDEQELLGGGLFLDEETGLYLAEVQVFHDLHCLNFIRKSLYPDYYSEMTSWSTWRPHLEHCIDALRLSLMCAGDMTLIPVKWSENRSWIMPIFETVHTCRDFDALRAWALERESVKDDTFESNARKLRLKAGIELAP